MHIEHAARIHTLARAHTHTHDMSDRWRKNSFNCKQWHIFRFMKHPHSLLARMIQFSWNTLYKRDFITKSNFNSVKCRDSKRQMKRSKNAQRSKQKRERKKEKNNKINIKKQQAHQVKSIAPHTEKQMHREMIQMMSKINCTSWMVTDARRCMSHMRSVLDATTDICCCVVAAAVFFI